MTSEDLGVAARRRITRQLLIGVPALVGAVLLIALLPPKLIESAKKRTSTCLDDAYKMHSDPSICRLGTGFDIAAKFPHVRSRANSARDELEDRRLDLAFEYELTRADEARRDRAAKALLAKMHDKDRALRTAAAAGAFSALASYSGPLKIDDRHVPAFAALAVGDIAAAGKQIMNGDPEDYDGASRSGALACLLGQRERGLALIRVADALWGRVSGAPVSATRFAAQHCGGTYATIGFEPFAVSSADDVEAVVSRAFDPTFQAGRRAALGFRVGQHTSIYAAGITASLALAAGSEHEPTIEELLAIITEHTGHDLDVDRAFAATPWLELTLDETSQFIEYLPPQWLELAAGRYERAARAVRKPIEIGARQVSVAAQADLLRRAAGFAYLHGAGYRIRRGDREGARADLAKARALDVANLWRAPLELAADDATSALATIDAWQAKQQEVDPGWQAVASVNRVLALAATGEFAKAQAAAATVPTNERGWLLLAMAIAGGAPLHGLLPQPTRDDDWKLTPEAMLVAIETKQLPRRLPTFYRADVSVLPAVAFVVAHAAQASGANPEVVLDRVFADAMPSRAVALARVEAARWRKDDATAQKWQARADAIEKLFMDDHAVVLAGIARLW